MESFRYENVPLPPNQLPLLVFEREHDSGGPGCEFHWHQELEFYYVITGGVLLSCGGEQEWLYPGDIGFVNSYLPHRGLDFLNGTRHYIIQINLDMLEGEICFSQNRSYSSLLLEKLRELPPFLREDPELTSLFSSLVQEWKGQKPGMELAAKGLLFQILVRLLRTAPQPSSAKNSGSWEPGSLEHVRDVLLYLSGEYPHPEKVSLPVIACTFGLSVPYLCRIFRRHSGRTVTAYLNELRCSRAAALIRSGVPLTEAAEQVGIRDYNYFSRMFKKTTGHSPSFYRTPCEENQPCLRSTSSR